MLNSVGMNINYKTKVEKKVTSPCETGQSKMDLKAHLFLNIYNSFQGPVHY